MFGLGLSHAVYVSLLRNPGTRYRFESLIFPGIQKQVLEEPVINPYPLLYAFQVETCVRVPIIVIGHYVIILFLNLGRITRCMHKCDV